jgi:hypothetical protein
VLRWCPFSLLPAALKVAKDLVEQLAPLQRFNALLLMGKVRRVVRACPFLDVVTGSS